jgi:hypothetical protein
LKNLALPFPLLGIAVLLFLVFFVPGGLQILKSHFFWDSGKKPILVSLLILCLGCLQAQDSASPSVGKESPEMSDDPSRFFTRLEIFNELQHYRHFVPLNRDNVDLNATTFRAIVKLGEKFTTRVDIPVVHNSASMPGGIPQSGIGDISFRILGYKILESPKRAIAISLECSLNTANSVLTGSGKNILIPLISYSQSLMKGTLLAFVFQQTVSFSGDKGRQDINFSKFQPILLHTWTKKFWTTLAPEFYLDFINGGTSMNLEGRAAFGITKRFNLYGQGGAGIFGDFMGRYGWSVEAGCRYFMFRKK